MIIHFYNKREQEKFIENKLHKELKLLYKQFDLIRRHIQRLEEEIKCFKTPVGLKNV